MKNEKLKVALVHDWLTTFGGSEQVLLSLHQLFPQAPIYTTIYNQKSLPQFKDAKIATSYLDRLPFAKTHHQVLIPLMPKAVESYDLSDFDLIISDSHACAKGAIKDKNAKHICYCHTPMRYVWRKEIDPRANSSWLRRQTIKYLKKWDLATIDRVDKYIANSSYIKERIKDVYHRDAVVIYPPVLTKQFYPVKSVKELGDYYLYVGRLISYKKPGLVIEAFNQLGLPIKVVGTGPELLKLKSKAQNNIEFLGKVGDEELRKIYARALAFVFPAEEDFGVVMVEAIASGRPVIAYEKGGSLEIVKKGISGEFFGEQTVESLISAIKSFHPEEYQPENVKREAEKFDQSIFKKRIIDYIKDEIKN